MISMPVWLRRSHAPGWGSVAVEVGAEEKCSSGGGAGERKNALRSLPIGTKMEAGLSLAVKVYSFNDQDQRVGSSYED